MPIPIRLVIADDSAAVRRLVTETLSKDESIEVVGAARDGRDALAMIAKTGPDVILLDVEMPVLDGIETLKKIRLTDKLTPVLMFSSLTVSGGEATLEALEHGANDFVPKPTAAGHIKQAIDYINAELLPKIKQWATSPKKQQGPAVRIGQVGPAIAATREPNKPGAIDVIAIGSSTGGPNALSELLPKLPRTLRVPVLIVQHMPATFTKLLAARLDKVSSLSVIEARDGALIRPGEIVIAPGNYHMTIKPAGTNRRISLNQDAPENSCRPAVDALFRSVANVYGNRSLAVILTGMGKDGLEGCRKLSRMGAFVIAQDEASSVVWGMPRAVSDEGLADSVLPLGKIHSEISQLVDRNHRPATNTI